MAGIVLKDDTVLLIERGCEPSKGYWSLPGGAVEVGEKAKDAVRREVLEETGLEVEVGGLVQVFDRITHDADGRTEYHFVLLDYECRPVGGRLCAADDANRAEWVRRGDVSGYRLTEGVAAVIEKAFESKQQ